MRALVLLPLLAGCSALFAGNDGTYLMTVERTANSCDEDDPSIGQQEEMLVSLYRTSTGSLVLDVGGMFLSGPAPEGQDFELGYEYGVEASYDGCDRYLEAVEHQLDGTFSADLGFEGKLKSTSRESSEGCPDDEEEVCTLTSKVTALKMNAATDRRPTGSIAWGYFSGGGGY